MSEYQATPEQLQKWREECEAWLNSAVPNTDGNLLVKDTRLDAEFVWQAARAIDAQRIAELDEQIETLKHGLEVIRGAAKNAVNFGDLQFVAATSLNKFDALAAAKRKGE